MANDNTKQEQIMQQPWEIIKEQRILDNLMVPVFFEPNSVEALEALQDMVRILLHDPGLVIERYQPEYVLSNIGQHSVRIDVWARDGSGRQLALELQKVTDDEVYYRAVFEGATMVVHSLPTGESYDKIDKVIVIFITQKDLEGQDKASYMYESMLTGRQGKRGRLTPIAPSYLFVNGQYRDDTTQIGTLIADIMQPDPNKMKIPSLRNRMKTLKNTLEGRKRMETALDRYVGDLLQKQSDDMKAEWQKQSDNMKAQWRKQSDNMKAQWQEQEAQWQDKLARMSDGVINLIRKGELSVQSAAAELGIPEEDLEQQLNHINSNE